jgi:hypothetical protein
LTRLQQSPSPSRIIAPSPESFLPPPQEKAKKSVCIKRKSQIIGPTSAPSTNEILDACFSNESECVIVVSLSATVLIVLNESTSQLRKNTNKKQQYRDIKPKCFGVTTHRAIPSSRKNTIQLFYASLNLNHQWRNQFGAHHRSPLSLHYANSKRNCDHLSLFTIADDAKTHLFLSIILELQLSMFHQWLGKRSFVVLRRPGNGNEFAVVCVIFRILDEVFIGHPDDPFLA